MAIPHGSYLFPILAFHISLVIGGHSYATQDVGQNQWAGLRTPWTLSDPKAWKAGNRQMGLTMPPISAACGLVALIGLFLPALRTPYLLFSLVFIQLAAILVIATRWWKPR